MLVWIYIYIGVRKVVKKLAKREKENVLGLRQMGVSSYDQRRIVIFQTWQIPPRILSNYRPAIRREYSPRFARIRNSPFPDSRLKLGSSDANSSNVINHTADFWTALRRPAKIREISQFLLYYCILKIGWYIYFFFFKNVRRNFCYNFVVEFLYVSVTISSSLIIQKLMKRKNKVETSFFFFIIILWKIKSRRYSRISNFEKYLFHKCVHTRWKGNI